MVKTIKYIDLCSGIGGFRIGIENFTNKKYKFICILSADIKKDAIKTYNLNFKEKNKELDINLIDPSKLNDFDLLCAGFPCQPFSTAGNKKGFDDDRGDLIFKIHEICKKKMPQTIILENVYNLLVLKNGEYIKKIDDIFTKLGYNVSYKKINSKDFLVPQFRERVFIVMSTKKKINLDNLKKNKIIPLKKCIDTNIITSDLPKDFIKKIINIHLKKSVYGCKIGDKRGGEKNIHSWDIGYNGEILKDEKKLMNMILLERRKKHWAKKKGIKWMDGMPLTKKEIETFFNYDKLENILDNLTKKNYLKLEKCKDIINGKRVYKKDSELGYNICKGKLSFPVTKILDPNDICPTLTATDSNRLGVVVKNKTIRKLTTNELKLICGFPINYKVPEDVNQYDLFGNMVTPPVVTAILGLIY